MGYIERQKSIFYIALTVIVLILACIPYLHTEEVTTIINRVDMQQEVSGTENGTVSTNITYKVFTSNGIYEIEQSGLFARPDIISRLHEGDTVKVFSRGYNFPVFNVYRIITDIE